MGAARPELRWAGFVRLEKFTGGLCSAWFGWFGPKFSWACDLRKVRFPGWRILAGFRLVFIINLQNNILDTTSGNILVIKVYEHDKE